MADSIYPLRRAWLGALIAVVLTATSMFAPAVSGAEIDATYDAQGPRPITGGQVESVTPNDEVAGAVHVVVAHPSDPNILWIGTVNGGIWRTTNATAGSPTWVPLTDQQSSLSIGALELDPTVATNTVLVAGIGRMSSFGRIGGPQTGLLRTTDAGTTWTPVGAAALAGENISGVAPRGNTIVVASNGNTNAFGPGQGGIFRTTNGGTTFPRLSGNGTSGLPNVGVFDLASDPSNNARLYAGTQQGIFRSTDTGATWTNVTNNLTGISNATTNNLELAVHNAGGNNVVYAGVINNGQLAGLWRSTDQGANWTQLDTPVTNEGGTNIGINPREKPGGQGGVHFSIRADPTNANLVYVGGDRQPVGAGNSWPNSIGANDFSGRLFRCNASLAAGSQCTPLTHSGTSDDSAPHADSREMVFDPNGDIIEVDDGGVYRQTDPSTTNGEWQSLNGNLQISEHHSCDYDNVGNLILCGNQDTGAPEQSSAGSLSWLTLSAGDGGFVAVNDSGASSIRFSSSNSFGAGSFLRRACTAANVCVNSAPGFIVAGSGGQTIQQFDGGLPLYTPLAMNKVDPTRFIVTSNRVYESTDSLDNFTVVVNSLGLDGNNNPIGTTRAIAYGGRAGGADNAGVLWFSDNQGTLFLRSSGAGAPVALPGWTNGAASDIVLDPENWADAYVSAGTNVFHTTDAGATFTNVTGNLGTVAPNANVRSLEIVPVPGMNVLALFAGTDTGVFMTQTQNLGVWAELGANLPNTIAFDLHFDAGDDVLLVPTMGRGTWLVEDISDVIPIADLSVTKTDSPDPVIAGEELFYTVTVTNDGPDEAAGVVVVDDLPDEVTFLEAQGEDPGIDCAYDSLNHRLTCSVGDLAPGESATFTIKTRVLSDAVEAEADGTLLIENTATASAASVDDDLSNNTYTEETFVQERADLAVTKVCKPDDELPAGQTGTCTIYVDNLGPSSARDIVLTDANLSDGAFTIGTITASQGSCGAPVNGVVTCQLGDLAAASATETGRATVAIDVSATEDVDINDVATVTSPTPDPDASNNKAAESISVMAVSDLSVVKTGPATAVAGTDITYDLTLTNGGPSTAQGVVVEDVLSAGVTILSVTASNGATCNAGVPGDAGLPTTCSFGTLAPGANRTMTIEVHILPEFVGALHNDARVTSSTFDNDLADNLDTVVTDVTASADLSIVKTDSPDPVLAGNLLTYTLVVSNSGPSTALDVSIEDQLPAGTVFAEGVDGNGATVCALVQPDTVVCDLGDMAPGTSQTVYITVEVDPSLPDTTVLSNTATVSSATPDPNPANDSDTASTNVDTAADVWVDKQATQRSGNPAPVVTYTLVVHNDTGCETDAQSTPTPNCGTGGPSDAQNVVVVDTLPLTPKKFVVQYVSPQCTYAKATHKVTCSTDTLPAGVAVTFVIEGQVNGSVGTILNTATVSSSTPDPDGTNNTNAATIVVKGGTGKK